MDMLLIKVSSGEVMTHFRMDQDYSGIAGMVIACILRFYPGETATAYALCDAELFQAQVKLGKNFVKGDPAGGGDFDVRLKSAVASQTIIPPNGVSVGSIDAGDDVVCYA